ncbi:YqhA family protein [Paraburkholderia antibiotica]|uniref:YqhA family protein n=1 Tax=Paraburkholderia antibiotica TaxID=2728839 RepID=A0A7Y0FGT3_9BURK|nr:YqhA family protein [Paraburkholderia antibiotica]NML35536.1 YqhA family protein [Paraburkholderia antibiotica]
MLRKILASSRYIMLIPVIATFLGSVALILFKTIVLFASVSSIIIANRGISPKSAKLIAVGIVESVDIFLIAIAVYIISIGLYSLFIDDSLPLPKWLEIRNLEDLKANLISVVIAVLSVLFLQEAVAWDGGGDILYFGLAVALVISALTLFLMKNHESRKGSP